DYKHMEELAIKIEDEEALKDYVNEKVLYSEANLEKEILLLQKYLYTGNERPDNLPGNTDERAKLQSYLDILQNHYTAINEVKREANGIEVGKDGEIKKVSTGIEWEDYSKSDPLLARVEYIKLDDEEDTNNDNYYRMKSEISIDYHQEIDEDRGLTRESYLEGPMATGRKNFSEVEYYKGDAVKGMITKEKNEEQDELNNMDSEFYDNKIMGHIISGGKKAAEKAGENLGKGMIPLSIAEEVAEYANHQSEKEEQKHIVELKEHETIAPDLDVELKVSERDVPRTWKGKNRQIEIYPTDETFERLRRWEALHDQYPSAIPYDAEAVYNQDWEEIHNTFGEIDSSKHEDLYNYIVKGTPNETVKRIDKELYHSD